MHSRNQLRKALCFLRNTRSRNTRKLSARTDGNTSGKHNGKHHDKLQDITNSAHPLCNYTSGRWLYNEHLRLAERQLHFDANALCRIIAGLVGKSRNDITLFAKIAEGGSYRVFEATFHDGLKVIARLPYPSTTPRRYGIASEVATMEFLRLHGVPIPRIFDWSSSASNEVRSEYIIMERVQGRELAETWYSMTFRERMAVVEKIVNVERILFAIQFPANGSLFFKDFLDSDIKAADMPENNSIQDVGKFCIGPSTEYLWWYEKRNELAVNRGPWKDTEEVLRAVGERELLWLQRFGKKQFPIEPLYRELDGGEMVDPQLQMKFLTDYLRVAKYLVPESEQLNMPAIRHPDFSPNNIFVSDSGEITGIIDWQHTAILPIFLQAKIPKHFQNYGDDDSESFRRPKLRDDFATLADSDKEVEMELYRRRQVHFFYLGYTSRLNKPHFDAMGKHNLILRNQLYDIAGRPWEGDNTSLQAALIRTMGHWSEIASSEDNAPIHYATAEVEECLERDAKQKNADERMQQVRDFIGINVEGWVSNEDFESATERATLIKSELAEAADTEQERKDFEEQWPFQDHEEHSGH